MRTLSLALCAALGLGACAGDDDGSDVAAFTAAETVVDAGPTEDDVLARLRAIPGLTFVEEQELPPGVEGRFFAFTFRQPADHLRPWAGSFEQRVSLFHVDATKPVVLFSTGYDLPMVPFRAEPTRILGGNQLAVEHRFFTPSRPSPENWSKLTVFQAAADHHRLVRAFRGVYAAPWVSTGHSKGGMTSIYHRRFFPNDVAATVAYVAPQDTIDREDSRYQTFLDNVGDDPACRDAIIAVQRAALERRDEMLAGLAAYAAESGFTFTRLLTIEEALEAAVIDVYWSFWQYAGVEYCEYVPPADAPVDELLGFIDGFLGLGFYTDQGIEPYVPYYYQAVTELGAPEAPDRDVADLLQHRGSFTPRNFVPDEIVTRHNPFTMIDVDLWVRLFGRRLLFVYGQDDPWSAEPFEIGPGTRDSYVYTVPRGNHGAVISQLPEAERLEAANRLRAWVGLPPLPPPPAPPAEGASAKRAGDAPLGLERVPGFDDVDVLGRRPRL